MKWLAIMACLAALSTPARGQVTVTDGDSLALGALRIRLHGIDAAELRQTCADGWAAGTLARDALAALVDRQTVECTPLTVDRYGRTVARCTAGGRDIGGAMVAAGMAWAFSRYSVEYEPLERTARARGLGVHARGCVAPWDWRAQRRPGN